MQIRKGALGSLGVRDAVWDRNGVCGVVQVTKGVRGHISWRTWECKLGLVCGGAQGVPQGLEGMQEDGTSWGECEGRSMGWEVYRTFSFPLCLPSSFHLPLSSLLPNLVEIYSHELWVAYF